MDSRVQKWKKQKPIAKIDGTILQIGCGAVGRAFLPLLNKLVIYKQHIIIDMLDIRSSIKKYLKLKNVKFVHIKVTKGNYRKILSKYLKAGDMLVDASYDIGTAELLKWTHDHGIRYLNMSVEEFDPFSNSHKKPQDFTLYERNQVIRRQARHWESDKINPTQLPDLGCNPGWVSAMLKKGLVDIAKAKFLNNPQISMEKKQRIQNYITNNYFKHLAYELGVKVVHITEKDTQISHTPRKPDEFCNTWSVSGFAEETSAPAELGWGTHENKLPSEAFTHATGEKNQICLHLRGCNKLIRSWTRMGPFVGMLVRHGESYSISSRFTLHADELKHPRSYIHDPLRNIDNKSKALYRPTVHFVYLPCDAGMATIHKLRECNYELGQPLRNMFDDIISGMDEIGCLIMGDFGVWWIGTSLNIIETRKIIDSQANDINATTLQAAGSLIAGVVYAIKHPNVGLCYPDDIDYREYNKIAKLFMGPVNSYEMTLTPKEMKSIRGFQFSSFEVNNYIL